MRPIPHTGVDALQAANALLTALYAHNGVLRERRSAVAGITHPYLNVGRIEGGSNTNVVPGKVVLKLDRRMIPEEDPPRSRPRCGADRTGGGAVAPASGGDPPPAAGPGPAAADGQRAAGAGACSARPGRLRRAHPTSGTPLYTDVRLYGAHGVPAVIYGAGPRTVLESNAKRADEHLVLEDLRRATKVVARTLA
jgi:succinyl-diaminopimelate desuccinylase